MCSPARRIGAFWLLLGLLGHWASGDTPVPRGSFRRLTTADGLSEPHIRAILQDRAGFLWVGTADGLGRYDGLGFRTFRHDPADPASVGPGPIMALLEDRSGQLWVGLLGGGLSRFDPETERFRHYGHDPADPNSLSQDDVADLLQGPEGELWVATGGGLNRLDPQTGHVTRFIHDPGDPRSLSGNEVTSLAQDPSGALWIGTGDGGLNRMTVERPGGRVRFEHWRHDPADTRSLSSDNVRCLLVDRHDRLWAGTWDGGLNRHDPRGSGFDRYGPVEGVASTWRGDRIYHLLEDHNRVLWIATWGAGLIRMDPATGHLTRYEPDPSDPRGLSHGNVASLYEDRSGLLWIATGGGGLQSLDLEGTPFSNLDLAGSGGLGAGVRDVRSVLEDREGSLWVGTGGGGVLRLDRSGRVLGRHRHVPSDPGSLADDNVWALLEDSQGTLWMGTFGGLDRFDRARGRFVHYRHDPRDTRSLANDAVYSLHEDVSGRLWVGTFDGLSVLDRATGRFVGRYGGGRDAEHPRPDTVVGISEDNVGAIWAAVGGDLTRLDAILGVLKPVPLLTGGREDKSFVWCLRSTPQGIWVGKGSDLFELRPSETGGPPQVRRHVPGPEAGIVGSLEAGHDGVLWLGTSRGLVGYDPANGKATRYDVGDGGPGGAFNFGASSRLSRGALGFGTTQGLTIFRPEDVRTDHTLPPVVLTRLRLGQREVPVGDPLLPQALSRTAELRLPYGEQALTVEFASLGFRAPRKNRSRYRLEGFDSDWSELRGDQREVTYTNLSPGRYVLRVMAASSAGVWDPAGASLVVRVLPPWWGTWWFRLLALGSVAGLLLMSHRARLSALHARSRDLEHELHQLRLMADALPVLIAYVDEHRLWVFANLACERWLGRPRAELQGKPIEEVLPAELLPVVEAHVARALAGQGGSFEMEVVDAAGKKRRLATTLVPRGEGTTRGFYGLAQDITKRARTEEAMRRQLEQLAHAARVLTLGELAAAIAHELNQPLTAILSNAEAGRMLLERPDSPASEVDEVLADISKDATRGGEIIRKLRELIRRRESRRETLDVNGAIRGIEPLLRAGALEDGVLLDLDLAPQLPHAQGDPIQIQQVVLNLARNALEAMRTTSGTERRLLIRSAREDESVVVEVADSGPSIDSGAFDRLFLPFFSTKADGLGMGLSISRSIVESHGGRIAGYRNPGGGLTVRFTLPAQLRSGQALEA